MGKAKVLLLLAILFFSISVTACEKEGGAEKAGKK